MSSGNGGGDGVGWVKYLIASLKAALVFLTSFFGAPKCARDDEENEGEEEGPPD